jgi:membrane protein DedA with SNARE-associated domain
MADRQRVDRIVDVASVVLISVAAVMTALCGYQSGRWGGQQARLYSMANADRILSAEAADKALAFNAINVNLFLNYVNAVDAGNKRKADFIYRRFGPVLASAMKAWLATKPLTNPSAPSSPFVMPQYALPASKLSRDYERQALENFKKAQDATQHSDDFLLLTVIFAGVSFLAGISTKMAFPRHLIIVTLGTLVTVYALVRLIELPFMGV